MCSGVSGTQVWILSVTFRSLSELFARVTVTWRPSRDTLASLHLSSSLPRLSPFYFDKWANYFLERYWKKKQISKISSSRNPNNISIYINPIFLNRQTILKRGTLQVSVVQSVYFSNNFLLMYIYRKVHRYLLRAAQWVFTAWTHLCEHADQAADCR